ncbi:response regulator [Phycicoccus jejuensis]|uniref:ATP-binding protein n=1 Tax=Phycicoccus jejuensis TaxID=367299 RepID=UPI00384D8B20
MTDPSPRARARDPRKSPRALLDSLFPGGDETSALARSTDWSATSLGDPSTWRPELAAAIRTVLPASIPMLLWWGEDLVQVYNDAYRPVCGVKHPRSMGQPAAQCWPEAWPELGPRVRRVVEKGVPDHEEALLLLLQRHGFVEETYWRYSFSPVRAADGEVLGVFVATTEVTPVVVEGYRSAVVRELAALPSLAVGSAQEAATRVVELLAADRRAVPFAALHLPDGDGALVRAASTGVVDGGEVVPARVEEAGAHALAVSGRTRSAQHVGIGPGDLVVEPPPLAGHRPTGLVHVPLGTAEGPLEGVLTLGLTPYRSVDEEYERFVTLLAHQISTLLGDVRGAAAERARVAAYAELDAAKSAVVANVSHEFRTPLTVVLAAARELRGLDLAADEAQQHLDAVERAAVRLDRLVGALLDVARAEAGRLEVERAAVDLGGLTRDVVAMFRSAVEAAGLVLDTDVEDVVALAHPDSWSTVVANLLSNAYRFTADGSIRVALRREGDDVVLEVADTGRGIAPEEVDAVLERFSRGPGRPVRGHTGTGIGLAHARDLVRAHGGSLTLEPGAGGGTLARVRVPVGDPGGGGTPAPVVSDSSLVAGLLDGAVTAGRREPVAVDEGMPDDRPLLVLVEDHDDVSGYLRRMLEGDGWRVVAVPDVPAALAVPVVPDLLLCDVMLPGPSGLDLVRVLRAERRWSTVPIVLLTARSGAREAAEGLAAGADDHVAKPFDPVELLARLRTHHELARRRNRLVDEAETRAENLEVALRTNRSIGMAVGVLMARHRVPSERAFEMLRRRSTSTNRKLRDIAEEVVHTGVLPG